MTDVIDYDQFEATFSLVEGEPEPNLGLVDLQRTPCIEKSAFDEHINDAECWISVGVGMKSHRSFVVCLKHLIYAWQDVA